MATCMPAPLAFYPRWYVYNCIMCASCAVNAIIFHGLKKRNEDVSRILMKSKTFAVACSLAGCLGSFLYLIGIAFAQVPNVIGFAGLIVSTYIVAFHFVGWVAVYAESDTRTVAILLLLVGIASSIAKAVLVVLPFGVSCVVVSILPAVSSTSSVMGWKKRIKPSDQRSLFAISDYPSMWKIWLLLVGVETVFGVVMGSGTIMFGTSSPFLFFGQFICTALVDGLLLFAVMRLGWFSSFTWLWRVVILLTGCLLLAMSFSPANGVTQMLFSSLASVTFVFMVMTASDVFLRTRKDVVSVMSLSALFLFVYYLVLAGSAAAIDVFFPAARINELAIVMMFLLVVMSASAWGAGDFVIRSIFEEVGPNPAENSEGASPIDAQVSRDAIAQELRLTTREAEISCQYLDAVGVIEAAWSGPGFSRGRYFSSGCHPQCIAASDALQSCTEDTRALQPYLTSYVDACGAKHDKMGG